MNELLDSIHRALQGVEEQLLQEFNRIRNNLSESRFEAINADLKKLLSSEIRELRSKLEHSGDQSELQLQTSDHEILFTRMTVVNQLLHAKVPTAYLMEVHKEVESKRGLKKDVKSSRRPGSHISVDDDKEQGGIVNSLKNIFTKEDAEDTSDETKGPRQIYLEDGTYSAASELAMLSHLVTQAAERELAKRKAKNKQPDSKQVFGKAQFESRDVTQKINDVVEEKEPQQVQAKKPEGYDIARSPEAIREKLAKRKGQSYQGKASFGGKDIEPIPQPVGIQKKAEPPKPPPRRGKASFTATDVEPVVPPSIRVRKEDPPKPPPPRGKATFTAKDIEPEAPPSIRVRKKEEPPKIKPSKGKAVFESKDLTGQPPTTKR